MPCRTDWPEDTGSGSRIEYQDNPMHLKTINELEAVICAVFNELEDRGELEEIIDYASVNGSINIKEIWTNHKHDDELRLKQELKRYSKHELKMIKNILNKTV